jgi:hypothetical protein
MQRLLPTLDPHHDAAHLPDHLRLVGEADVVGYEGGCTALRPALRDIVASNTCVTMSEESEARISL